MSSSSPLIGSLSGTTTSASNIAAGESVRCDYRYKDPRTAIDPNIDATLSNPSPPSIYEEGSGTSLITVSVKNTGNVTLTGVGTVNGSCTSGTLASLVTTACKNFVVTSPGMGALSQTNIGVTVTATATINPDTQYFRNMPTSPTTYKWLNSNHTSILLTRTEAAPITVLRIKLPV